MIIVAEPNFASQDHAPGNVSLLWAVSLAFPDDEILLAATLEHCYHMERSAPFPKNVRVVNITIARPEEGRVWRLYRRWVAFQRLGCLQNVWAIIFLSSGPETFFIARLLADIFRGARVFIVLHGNVRDAFGRRSPDPRNRLIDYRSGLRVSRHKRVKLVALEQYIRDAINETGIRIGDRLLVWPNPISSYEICAGPRDLSEGGKIRLAYIGAARRSKGFSIFLELANSWPRSDYEFSVIGHVYDSFSHPELGCIQLSNKALERSDYVQQLRDIDYAIMPFDRDVYNFTASGSLLDCVAQLKPIITTDAPAICRAVSEFGSIGLICRTIEEIKSTKTNAYLRDRQQYASFQQNLTNLRNSRLPEALSITIRETMSEAGLHVGC